MLNYYQLSKIKKALGLTPEAFFISFNRNTVVDFIVRCFSSVSTLMHALTISDSPDFSSIT
jgi:hypothetical protein